MLEAIAELSPSLRVTLVLATIEDLPHKQIAEILEIPEGTVAWRVNEARRLAASTPRCDRAHCRAAREVTPCPTIWMTCFALR